ncbi:MAG: FG-GAP repeat protein, partial [Planctomycetales bacterium]|nr:FG-GAP repeat protein [Planctomycetales bacterium]
SAEGFHPDPILTLGPSGIPGSIVLGPSPYFFPETWHQGNLKDSAESHDAFGSALAVGDFNNDQIDDLAIGIPGEDIGWKGNIRDAGAVSVVYGTSDGLSAEDNQVFYQSYVGKAESGDQFGASLAVGDFDNDGADDLVVGVPYEDLGSVVDAGAVHVIYGTTDVGLTTNGSQTWHQNSAYINGTAGKDDRFGFAIATGDFDNDGRDDLALGVPGDDGVNVIYGRSNYSGLTASRDAFFSGYGGDTLTSGDFDADGYDDLAIGDPTAQVSPSVYGSDDVPFGLHPFDEGTVHVLYGSGPRGRGFTGGLAKSSHQELNLGSKSSHENSGNLYGNALVAGDFNGDGMDDLAIHAPGKNCGGAAHVVYGRAIGILDHVRHPIGLSPILDSQWWNQDSNKNGHHIADHVDDSDCIYVNKPVPK